MHSVQFAVSFVLGCGVGLFVAGLRPGGIPPHYGWALLACAALAALAGLVGRPSGRALAAAGVVSSVLFGAALTLLAHPPLTPSNLAWYNGAAGKEPVTVLGEVAAAPVPTDRSLRVRVSARQLALPGEPPREVSGDLLAVLPRYPEYSEGERLSVTGVLTAAPSFGTFDYAGYLARQGIGSYMTFPKVRPAGVTGETGPSRLVSSLRGRAAAALRRHLPEPQAAVTVGVVTGDRSSMSREVLDSFKVSGTYHLLAISGQNIALLVGIVMLAFGRGGRRRPAVWLTLAVIALLAGYAAFTGAAPSVVRASAMGAIMLLGPVVGRRYDPVAALCVTAAFMLALDPNLLLDAGFQLSFAAMAGISAISPMLMAALLARRVPAVVALPLAVSLGAQAASVPLGAMWTGQVSLVSPLATLAGDLALAPLMIAGILTALLDLIGLGAVAAIPAAAAWASAGWLLESARLWASVPGASVGVDVPPAVAVVYYVTLALCLRLALLRRAGRPVERMTVVRFALGVAAVGVWAAAFAMLFR
ncbi:MAG TPA: ComEC/Rec2 family competence protein [Chloroflexia bacterium]|nr:ComEC/Rec2 family competence protein [Chloroflexia bacterium]